MSEPIVQVEHLRKEFDGTVAVADVSFSVSRGEIVGVLGPNGAGKTTTIQVLLGLTTPTSGIVRIFGQDLEKHRVEILQRCNFSSAYTGLPSNLKVWENLLIFSKIYGVNGHREKTDQLLELFEIAHLRNKITGHLSSGESTRVNLCKALLNDPELLMLDEPTASLDPDIADKVRKLLRRIQREKGITMVYTSHNMRDVEEVCDRVLFMHKGRIIAEGTPQQVKDKFNQKSLEEVFIRVARSGDLLGQEADMNLRRISALVLRYTFLYTRSVPRVLEMFFWPVMDLLVWGFVTVYLIRLQQPGTGRRHVPARLDDFLGHSLPRATGGDDLVPRRHLGAQSPQHLRLADPPRRIHRRDVRRRLRENPHHCRHAGEPGLGVVLTGTCSRWDSA